MMRRHSTPTIYMLSGKLSFFEKLTGEDLSRY